MRKQCIKLVIIFAFGNLAAIGSAFAGPIISFVPSRPVADFEPMKYVILMGGSDTEIFDAETLAIPSQIAKLLPSEIVPIFITRSPRPVPCELSLMPRISVTMPIVYTGSGYWPRDRMPVPVLTQDGSLGLTSALYFKGQTWLDTLYGALGTKENYANAVFEGGNFTSDDRGNCFTIAGGPELGLHSLNLSDEDFRDAYGCRTITRLPYVRGIGHVDEMLRPVSSKTMMVSTHAYDAILQAQGYELVHLPEEPVFLGEYVNSLLVNGTAFVPTFGVDSDLIALKAYRDQGFHVIPINGRPLAKAKGGIHCMAMGYPQAPREVRP